jgi:hypothetical protein
MHSGHLKHRENHLQLPKHPQNRARILTEMRASRAGNFVGQHAKFRPEDRIAKRQAL